MRTSRAADGSWELGHGPTLEGASTKDRVATRAPACIQEITSKLNENAEVLKEERT